MRKLITLLTILTISLGYTNTFETSLNRLEQINYADQINNPTQPDKVLHFFVGASVSAITYFTHQLSFGDGTKASSKKSKWIAIGFGALVGVGKEIYDHRNGGKFSGGDILATMLGAVSVTFTF